MGSLMCVSDISTSVARLVDGMSRLPARVYLGISKRQQPMSMKSTCPDFEGTSTPGANR